MQVIKLTQDPTSSAMRRTTEGDEGDAAPVAPPPSTTTAAVFVVADQPEMPLFTVMPLGGSSAPASPTPAPPRRELQLCARLQEGCWGEEPARPPDQLQPFSVTPLGSTKDR